MRSTLCSGTVFHERFAPGPHSFAYSIYHLRIDLDELAKGVLNGIFARDRFGIISMRTTDYLPHKPGSLQERVQASLLDDGIQELPARTELVTMPRVFGYVFNPVNFFLCRRADESLIALLVEVSNTFGEKHLYVLRGENGPRFQFPKEFYVSPFFDVSGEYCLTLGDCGSNHINIVVELYKNGEKQFVAGVSEKASTLTRWSLLGAVIRMPFSVLLAMTRIHLQAFRLFAKKAAFLVGWKRCESPATIVSRQSTVHRARLGLLNVFRFLERRSS